MAVHATTLHNTTYKNIISGTNNTSGTAKTTDSITATIKRHAHELIIRYTKYTKYKQQTAILHTTNL